MKIRISLSNKSFLNMIDPNNDSLRKEVKIRLSVGLPVDTVPGIEMLTEEEIEEIRIEATAPGAFIGRPSSARRGNLPTGSINPHYRNLIT
jgi:hypothetical protein